MTDYYVLGDGRTIKGPYRLEDARNIAANIAEDNRTVAILAETETVKGVGDEEIKPGYEDRIMEGADTPQQVWERGR